MIAAGLLLTDLATAAGIAPSTLSDYISGRTRNVHGQIRICEAFCRLTGRRLSARQFWGRLIAREAA